MRPSLHPEIGLISRTAQSLTMPLGPTLAALRPPSTAHVLASMLDLHGSVRLAHCLRARTPAASTYDDARAPLLLGDYVRARLASIEETTFRRLARPHDAGRTRLPNASEVLEQIAESDTQGSRAVTKALAASLWRTQREYLVASVARVRFEVATLREEVASDLRALGPVAMRLEAIDATLRTSIDDAFAKLLERLAFAMEGAFVEALTTKLTAFFRDAAARESGATAIAAIAPWFVGDGVFATQLTRTRDVVRGALSNESAVLVALVDGACKRGVS